MNFRHGGIAPLVIVLIVAAGLLGGASAGYVYREPIKKAIQGKTTGDEISDAINQEIAKINEGRSKFELEGVIISIEENFNQMTVKIKSSTDSIKELRLAEALIEFTDSVQITFGELENPKITDIPLNSQVHIGGNISDGKLIATKIIVQKEEAGEGLTVGQENKVFTVGGEVKAVASDSLTITVNTANKWANSQKDKDLEIKISSNTIIEKQQTIISLSEIVVGSNLQIIGAIEEDVYTASKIIVKVQEEIRQWQGPEQEEEQNLNRNTNENQGASPQNQESEKEQEKESQ